MKGLPDAPHVVPDGVTSHEIDSLFDECRDGSCSQHPGLDMARGAPIQTVWPNGVPLVFTRADLDKA